MKKELLIGLILLLVASSVVLYFILRDDKNEEVRDMKNLTYKTQENQRLLFDIYRPKKEGENCNPVVLIHGQTSDANFKDTDYMITWANRMADKGCLTFTFNWRSYTNPEDIHDFFQYLYENKHDLHINANSIHIITFSKGVNDGVRQSLTNNSFEIKSIVAFYGELPLDMISDDLPLIFVAMGGLDTIAPSNCNDTFINNAQQLGIHIEKVVYEEGRHGFDANVDDSEAMKIVNQAIDFILENSDS